MSNNTSFVAAVISHGFPYKYLNYSLVDSLCVLRLFCLDTCRSSLPSPANPNNSILNKRMAHFPIVAVSRAPLCPNCVNNGKNNVQYCQLLEMLLCQASRERRVCYPIRQKSLNQLTRMCRLKTFLCPSCKCQVIAG